MTVHDAVAARDRQQAEELRLRETNHRCSNDLQLVVALLRLQSRRAASAEARRALADAMERVSVLAHARKAMHDGHASLAAALRQICDALHAQAEPRAIAISLDIADGAHRLSPTRVTTLALVVNELATNAIKHAFADGSRGRIAIAVTRRGPDLVVTVDDDGRPFPRALSSTGGLGLTLARRLMASIDGELIAPAPPSKMFELRLPFPKSNHAA